MLTLNKEASFHVLYSLCQKSSQHSPDISKSECKQCILEEKHVVLYMYKLYGYYTNSPVKIKEKANKGLVSLVFTPLKCCNRPLDDSDDL